VGLASQDEVSDSRNRVKSAPGRQIAKKKTEERGEEEKNVKQKKGVNESARGKYERGAGTRVRRCQSRETRDEP